MGLCCSNLDSPRDSAPPSFAPYHVAGGVCGHDNASDEETPISTLIYKRRAPPPLLNIPSNFKVCAIFFLMPYQGTKACGVFDNIFRVGNACTEYSPPLTSTRHIEGRLIIDMV